MDKIFTAYSFNKQESLNSARVPLAQKVLIECLLHAVLETRDSAVNKGGKVPTLVELLGRRWKTDK